MSKLHHLIGYVLNARKKIQNLFVHYLIFVCLGNPLCNNVSISFKQKIIVMDLKGMQKLFQNRQHLDDIAKHGSEILNIMFFMIIVR